MVFPMKCLARRVTAGLCVFLLVLLLAACGGSNNSGATSNTGSNTSNDTSTGSNNTNDSNARPVQQMVTPTATATASSKLTLKEYTGSGFTIKYPQDWKVTNSSTSIAFTDPSGNYSMTVNSQSNANGAMSEDQLVTNELENVKKGLKDDQTVNMPATATVGGQSWTQQAVSGSSTVNGKSSEVQTVVLGTNHPTHAADTKGYSITYAAPKDEFSQTSTTYFTPMLDTFTFTS